MLRAELFILAKEERAVAKVRAETHSVLVTAKAELEEGTAGVNNALSVLRDYNANAEATMKLPAKPTSHAASDGAGGCLVNIRLIIQADFSKQPTDFEVQEADAQGESKQLVQENKVLKTSLDADVTYKSQEFRALTSTLSTTVGT